MSLVEFLRARLDEDEAAARAVEPLGHSVDMGGRRNDDRFAHGRMGFASEDGMPRTLPDGGASAHFARHDPARVLAEVEAKRRILEWAPIDLGEGHSTHIFRLLALPYADHPDYREEWRP